MSGAGAEAKSTPFSPPPQGLTPMPFSAWVGSPTWWPWRLPRSALVTAPQPPFSTPLPGTLLSSRLRTAQAAGAPGSGASPQAMSSWSSFAPSPWDSSYLCDQKTGHWKGALPLGSGRHAEGTQPKSRCREVSQFKLWSLGTSSLTDSCLSSFSCTRERERTSLHRQQGLAR